MWNRKEVTITYSMQYSFHQNGHFLKLRNSNQKEPRHPKLRVQADKKKDFRVVGVGLGRRMYHKISSNM